ncbi:MAG: nicotinate (nicotinamide) nucleotide adenylyltransferase [Alphaproteobacteria bacterium]|nr:nicotinate (nicotinamide) nucleotide adenylyltransferase [Alphaproteobacteria bacterium]
MKIGLYFGSFNPIHQGHLIIANHCLNSKIVEKIWFIVSPQNPQKNLNDMLNPELRLLLVDLAISNNSNFQSSQVEFYLSKPSYTYNTMIHLKATYPQDTFYIILGSDSFINLPHWAHYELLFNENLFIVYERFNYMINNKESYNKVFFLDNTPIMNLSSTFIRDLILKKQSIKYLVPENVENYIIKNKLYI